MGSRDPPPQTHFCLSLCLQPARYCNGSIQHTVCSAALRNSLLLSPFMLLKRGGDNTRVTHLPKTRELILYRLLNNACAQQICFCRDVFIWQRDKDKAQQQAVQGNAPRECGQQQWEDRGVTRAPHLTASCAHIGTAPGQSSFQQPSGAATASSTPSFAR